MKTPLLLKISTIVLFALLIVAFVSYRSGYLSAVLPDEEENTYDTAHAAKMRGANTLPVKPIEYDTVGKFTFPGSKSAQMFFSTTIKIPPLKITFDSAHTPSGSDRIPGKSESPQPDTLFTP